VTGKQETKKVYFREAVSVGTVNATLGEMNIAVQEQNSAFHINMGI
jgi:hypothetical protein